MEAAGGESPPQVDVENQADSEAGKSTRRFRWRKPSLSGPRWFVALPAIILIGCLLILLWWLLRSSESSDDKTGLFVVRRSSLPITVTENGDIKAVNSVDIKSEVEGRTTIISIVDEGTYITPEDVNGGKILVKLDSSETEQSLTQQEVQFLTAEAAFTDANESLDIQKKENESEINKGRMKVRFGLMDLQKYIGDKVAEKLVSLAVNPGIEHAGIASFINDPNNESLLGGDALQKLRDLDGDIHLKRQELELAKTKLEWTEKLHEKEYVPRNELEADRLDKERKDIALERAKTAKELFIKYEFPKEAEKRLSDYDEAKRELERTEARARSKLAQAEAKLGSAKATYLLQKKRLEKLQKQLEACTIKAPKPGQVVYASSEEPWFRQDRMIEEGAEIYERQKIISIPDPAEMKVVIKVHETWIDKVKAGQIAQITVAAFPDKAFTGKVLKKAPLADQQWWGSPDLKVYAADVSIDGTHDFIKTGMSAKVEIKIDEVRDVLTVPVQVVITQAGEKLCYVMTNGGPEKRKVETGAFNNSFVEISKGLVEGEKVMLNPPRPAEGEEALAEEKPAIAG
jgi:multidrug efflux pump subunit AcrA (membrane-fusion protein)